MKRIISILTMLILSTIIMVACGGGGSGGGEVDNTGNNNNGNNNEDNEIAYSVGGVINGFSRSPDTNEIGRATLQNNGTDNLELYGDRSFSFSIKLKVNESYNVTILSEPDWQTCQVNNGSGIINGSDVLDIRVICEDKSDPVPLSYSISGTISGYISPDDISIALDLTREEIKITNNGEFTFRTKVEDNSFYNVYTMRKSSWYPYPQICETENGSGNIDGKDITNIQVNCIHYNVKLISKKQNGEIGNSISSKPVISEDGKLIVFQSNSRLTNILSEWVRKKNIFVYNTETKSLRLISSNTYGRESNFASSNPDINNSGQFIVFQSASSDLVLNDENDHADIFIYDYETGRKKLISIASDGTQANSFSINPIISNSGRYVSFKSMANNLIDNNINNEWQNFIHDTETGETFLNDMTSPGIFSSSTNSADVIYSVADSTVFNNRTAESEMFAKPTDFNPKYEGGKNPNISKDGKWIVFESKNNPLVPMDNNANPDIYLVPNPLFK